MSSTDVKYSQKERYKNARKLSNKQCDKHNFYLHKTLIVGDLNNFVCKCELILSHRPPRALHGRPAKNAVLADQPADHQTREERLKGARKKIYIIFKLNFDPTMRTHRLLFVREVNNLTEKPFGLHTRVPAESETKKKKKIPIQTLYL